MRLPAVCTKLLASFLALRVQNLRTLPSRQARKRTLETASRSTGINAPLAAPHDVPTFAQAPSGSKPHHERGSW
ncbi:hypothetical protein [Streptomyces roseoverticillatus]|uniref:Secreted protein n=1 Tax=Streptomyces roseoverticillatus TaxID=66429 RepID=A0ABV3J392_9ACTN